MILNERDIRHPYLIEVAKQMMIAARTAPKGKGIDVIECATLTGEDILAVSRKMREMYQENGMKFFLRDADNILQAEAMVLIGTREKAQGLNCGYCGFPTCKDRVPGAPCQLNVVDLGIAIGSACAMAADLRVDSRVMFSAGRAAQEMNILPGSKGLIAIPISASSKNPFFDRIPKAEAHYMLPAEWHQQGAVQLTWPHAGTDWAYMLDEVQDCFVRLAQEISKRQHLLVVAPDVEAVRRQLEGKVNLDQVTFFACETNDTWARDHAFLTVIDGTKFRLMDFKFNGWGAKFEASLDNAINRKLYDAGLMKGEYADCLDFVLEGGSVESDGEGTLLVTSTCLLAPHRNQPLTQNEIDGRLKSYFGLKQVLWLDHGYLAGDDTDSHVDTLARLCPDHTIVYVQCTDKNDEHYEELHRMEEQLHEFRTLDGQPYRLLPLPMADAVFADGERLPATYANFLIMNKAVLYPTYNQLENDRKAGEVLLQAFPGYEIVGVDCQALIKQHGSLHCVTMQYPAGAFVGK